jgi:hypothetical protein
MKNGIWRFILVLAIAALWSSCAITHEMIVDEQNPVEDNVQIQFTSDTKKGSFALKEWNGINLEESLYKSKWTSSEDKAKLTVPSGDNSFTFNIRYTNNNTAYIFENIELRYILEPGRKYTVKGRRQGFFMSFEYFIGIYDTTNGSELLKEWKIGES